MSKILHNPKSHAPAVYIPCWLIQVPHNELSFGAKILYGRLAQWCTTKGIVYRSTPQLSNELGMGVRTIERFIKELKGCNLIGTHHPQAGGVNHFEFYDHEWMHRDLTKELNYQDVSYPLLRSEGTPPPMLAVPPARLGGTPPPMLADINIKKIKEIKTSPTSPSGKKINSFSLTQMLENNSFNIPEPILNDWIEVRKGKKAKMTATAWEQANQNLSKLKEAGLCPIECFKKSVANGWSGVEYRYFQQDIDALKGVSTARYPMKDEKAANDLKIRERELKAQAEKRLEIEARENLKKISSQVANSFDLNEESKKQEAERKSMGLTAVEYHKLLIRKANSINND